MLRSVKVPERFDREPRGFSPELVKTTQSGQFPEAVKEARIPRKYPRQYNAAVRIEDRIERAQGSKPTPTGWAPGFPFPFRGPFAPPPGTKEESRKFVSQVKDQLRITTEEMAEFLHVPFRTLQKWQQGISRISPSAWYLLQASIRSAEIRKSLRESPAAPANRDEFEPA